MSTQKNVVAAFPIEIKTPVLPPGQEDVLDLVITKLEQSLILLAADGTISKDTDMPLSNRQDYKLMKSPLLQLVNAARVFHYF